MLLSGTLHLRTRSNCLVTVHTQIWLWWYAVHHCRRHFMSRSACISSHSSSSLLASFSHSFSSRTSLYQSTSSQSSVIFSSLFFTGTAKIRLSVAALPVATPTELVCTVQHIHSVMYNKNQNIFKKASKPLSLGEKYWKKIDVCYVTSSRGATT